jgi:membrane protein required for colicin V production
VESINFFIADIFVVIVIALSSVIGLVRGATKELLSVASWIGGIFLTVSLFPGVKDLARTYIKHGLIADFITACTLFLAFLTILSIVNYFCSNMVKKSMLNTVDRALGCIFGIVRGVIILGIIDLAVNQCILTETPEWIHNSKMRPIINSVSNFIILTLPEKLQIKILAHMSQIKKQNLLDFIKNDIVENIGSNLERNSHDAFSGSNKVIASDATNELETIRDENDESTDNVVNNKTQQSAEELASLKPKKNSNEGKKDDLLKKLEKGRNDMNRLLEQYDDIDEE